MANLSDVPVRDDEPQPDQDFSPRQIQLIRLREFQGRLSQGEQTAVNTLRAMGRFPEPIPRVKGMSRTPPSTPGSRRAGLEILGGTFGGPVGRGAARGLGGLLRGMGGAGAGGAGGSLTAETFDPSERPLARAAKTGAFMAGGEVAGAGLARLGRAISDKTPRNLVQGGQEARDIVRQRGGVLPPGFVSRNRMVNIMQNVAERSFFGASAVSEAATKARSIVSDEIERFSANLARNLTPEEGGVLVTNLIEGGIEAFKASGRAAFKRVDDRIGEVLGQTAPTRGGAREVPLEFVNLTFPKARAAEVLADAERGVRSVNTQARGVAKDILSKPDVVTFREAQTIRSDLLAIGRSITEPIPGRTKTAASRIAPAMDKAISDGFKAVDKRFPGDESLQTLWRNANNLWKTEVQDYNNKLIKGLLTKDPEFVVQSFLKNNSVTGVRRVKKILDKQDLSAWPVVQKQFVDGVIGKATDDAGNLIGRKMLRSTRSFGDEALRELFPNAVTLSNWKTLSRTLEVTQQRAIAEGTGGVAIQLMQPGALAGLATGFVTGSIEAGFGATAATVLFAPPVLSRVLASPRMSRWLIEGIKAPPGSAQFTNLMTKISAALAQDTFAPSRSAQP